MIEIESKDPEVKAILADLKAADPENIDDVSSSQMGGQDIMVLLIENVETLSAAAVGIIATLRFHQLKLKLSKDGIELSGKHKDAVLDKDGAA